MRMTFFYIAFAITGVMAAIGFYYNITLMNDCINSGNPNSQECFRYNVMNNNLRNVNISGE